MKRGRVIAAIAVVAILGGGGALVWFRSRPRWISKDVGGAALTPSGELVVATSAPGESGALVARMTAKGATTKIASARNIRHLVASSTHAFWTEKQAAKIVLRRAPLAGGDATDLCEVSKVTALAASKDRVFWSNEAHDVMTGDGKTIAHGAYCIAGDDAGAFAATTSGIVRLETGDTAFDRSVAGHCNVLLSESAVWLATWTDDEGNAASSLARAPRSGGAFETVRTEAHVASWYRAGGGLAWTSVESLGKDRDGFERTAVLTHVVRGKDARVVATGDTAWVGGSGDTLYLLEPDGLRAVRAP